MECRHAFVDALPELPQIAVCAVGLMGQQREDECDIEAAVHVMPSNYESPSGILAIQANRFDERGNGIFVNKDFPT